MLGSKPVSGRQITCYFCLIARYAPSTKDGAKGGRAGASVVRAFSYLSVCAGKVGRSA